MQADPTQATARGGKVSPTSDTNITRARDGAPWTARFSYKNKSYSQPLNTTDRREALKLAADFVARTRGELVANDSMGLCQMTLGTACELWLEKTTRRAKNTKARVIKLRAHIGDDVLLSDLTGKHVEDMMAKRRTDTRPARRSAQEKADGVSAVQPIAKSTANFSVDLLRTIVGFATDRLNAVGPKKPIKWDIFKDKIEKKRDGHLRKYALYDDKRDAILEAINPDYRPITCFALLTGLRASECLLKWSQIDWNAKPHPIAREVFGKGHRDHGREIELLESAVAVLRAEMGKHPTAVFTYKAGRTWTISRTSRRVTKGECYPITYAGWKAAWALMLDAIEAQGFSRARIHDTRHTFATALANDPGMSVFAVMSEMGHADPKTTMGYISPNNAAAREAKRNIILPGIGKGLREVAQKVATKLQQNEG